MAETGRQTWFDRWGSRLRRLPRPVYWAVGAAVACGGAVGARLLADDVPPSQQVAIWLTGGVLIFIGLAILSLGTRARLEDEERFAEGQDGDPGERKHRPNRITR